MMEQVSGRAGRKNDQGKVIVQLSQTNHPVIGFVKDQKIGKRISNAIVEQAFAIEIVC